MQRVCTTCGLPLWHGERFCAECGKPVDATARSTGARTRKSIPALNIVQEVRGVCALGAILAMVSLALIGCSGSGTADSAESQAVEESGGGGAITIETLDGPVSLVPNLKGAVKVPAIPIYPGAQAISVDAELTMGGMGPASGMDYHTPDDLDKVAAYYTEELSPKAEPLDRNVEVLFRFEDGDMNKIVRLGRHPGFGGTKIGIYQMPK